MAEPVTNGASDANQDVEMQEEAPADVRRSSASSLPVLTAFQTSLNNIQQADQTDPNPPPQTIFEPVMLSQPEHLSTIAPAIATPPAGSTTTRPGSMPPQPSARPEKPVAHGGPTRQFLNTNVTPHLLEGMKYVAVYEPEKPLLWLADFLRDRSKEIEG